MATAAPVLVVDDEHALRRLLRLYLEKEGYAVLEAHDGLAVVRRALQTLAVDVDVDSTPGQVSEFRVTLPADGSDAQRNAGKRQPSNSGWQ